MTKNEVIKSLVPGAVRTYGINKIFPSVTLAQAILETGWLKYCKGNNLFGIKWTDGCSYDSQLLPTHEWVNGVKTPFTCRFRKYNSYEDSLMDHGKLLNTKRYEKVRLAKNYTEACRALYECGYCTDYEYPEKLIKIIEENQLYNYDKDRPIEPSNSSSEDIKMLQRNLNILKIKDYEGKLIEEDGIMGERTESAIKSFQAMQGISQDGVYGPNTKKAMEAILKRPICSLNEVKGTNAIKVYPVEN